MKVKNKIWRYATVFVVIFLILNPEMAELSVFINAIGLDIFILLLQVQILTISGMLFPTKIKQFYSYLKYQLTNNILGYSFTNIKNEPKIGLLIIPSQAAVMHMLVLSALLGTIINA